MSDMEPNKSDEISKDPQQGFWKQNWLSVSLLVAAVVALGFGMLILQQDADPERQTDQRGTANAKNSGETSNTGGTEEESGFSEEGSKGVLPSSSEAKNELRRLEKMKSDLDSVEIARRYNDIATEYPETLEGRNAKKFAEQTRQKYLDDAKKRIRHAEDLVEKAKASGAFYEARSTVNKVYDAFKRDPGSLGTRVISLKENLKNEIESRFETHIRQSRRYLSDDKFEQAINELQKVRQMRLPGYTKKVEDEIFAIRKRWDRTRNRLLKEYHKEMKPIYDMIRNFDWWKAKKEFASRIKGKPEYNPLQKRISLDEKAIETHLELFQEGRNAAQNSSAEDYTVTLKNGSKMTGRLVDLTREGMTLKMGDFENTLSLEKLPISEFLRLVKQRRNQKRPAVDEKLGVYYLYRGEVGKAMDLFRECREKGGDPGEWILIVVQDHIPERLGSWTNVVKYSTFNDWKKVGGTWKKSSKESAILGDGSSKAYFQYKKEIPEEYVLQIKVQVENGHGFRVGFPFGEKVLIWRVGQVQESLHGVPSMIENHPETRVPISLYQQRYYLLRVIVTRHFSIGFINLDEKWRLFPGQIQSTSLPERAFLIGTLSSRVVFGDVRIAPLK